MTRLRNLQIGSEAIKINFLGGAAYVAPAENNSLESAHNKTFQFFAASQSTSQILCQISDTRGASAVTGTVIQTVSLLFGIKQFSCDDISQETRHHTVAKQGIILYMDQNGVMHSAG
jgi:hypothetical protein